MDTDFQRAVVAYYRTSSAGNVGDDKDSKTRQAAAVKKYADKNNLRIVEEYYDAAVKGADPVLDRKDFKRMFHYMLNNGIKTMLVEAPDRFARDLGVQINALNLLKENGLEVIPVNAPEHFTDETPTSKFIRVMLGALSELDKDSIVLKLKSGRDKKKALGGRCEGRKPAPPEAIKLAASLKEEGLSLRAISLKLAEAGFFVMRNGLNALGHKVRLSTGKPYSASSVRYMLDNLGQEDDVQES